jgi:uncharacterized protein
VLDINVRAQQTVKLPNRTMEMFVIMRTRIVRLIILLIGSLSIAACSSLERSEGYVTKINTEQGPISEESRLMQAIRNNDHEQVRQAILSGDSVNALYNGDTPLKLALKEQRPAMARLLLKAGASPNFGFQDSELTALMLAAKFALNDVVSQLLRMGSDIDSENEQGYTALAYAVIGGHLSTLNLLLDYDASPNAEPMGQSLLMHAVADNNMIIALPLIEAGADLNFSDANGVTALLIAREKGYYDLDLMLVQAGARL